MDEVFKALADPSRRRLLDSLNSRNGQTLRELCAGLEMARQSVSKHLAVLAAAELVTTQWRGREKLHYLNAAPINAIADRWITHYHRPRAQALADLKTALEQGPMDPFVYTTYIRTTPEQLWAALTTPSFTQQYWGATLESDWRPGSTITWTQGDWSHSDPEQVVLEADPHRRLAYTWHTFTPEFAPSVGLDPELGAKLAAEPRSKASFDIEALGELVKLTVTHDGFAPDSVLRGMISEGWVHIIANLKTLLETGSVLPEPAPQDA
ncbi:MULTISPECIES: metalloregulator ArsR/SmtB family transcription factor [unclassified Crossiella]|uniref:ArsR/SmtB family transcription factor n=1 Tax=unclassified Crossiella TaxID=2620835 RepID=UPI001FFF3E81|nr:MULTISPECIES: metalloregulator ArsR/SmtB family transcription factor [unclassified Crossiella]MCK2238577.1 metalloregulator ArsR/SmtB family transcription factor [Crossiella sp. S99.2]MCK2251853.1 metalloregulator ArsR/SmtB family transcription factor [Crossiella sp. S99.1]